MRSYHHRSKTVNQIFYTPYDCNVKVVAYGRLALRLPHIIWYIFKICNKLYYFISMNTYYKDKVFNATYVFFNFNKTHNLHRIQKTVNDN